MTREEAMMFLREFMHEVNTQDCRGTARPFYYVIRTAIFVASYHEDEGDRFVWVRKDDGETITADNIEQAIKEYHEYMLDDDEVLSDSEIEEILESDFERYAEKKEWAEHGCFFTESDANQHLKANHYHYSSDAHTYVKHCWRAPAMEKFFEALNVIVAEKG